MLYSCPNCGELIDEDIIAQCGKCGSNEVEEEGNNLICPCCDGVSDRDVILVCAICGSESNA